MLIRVCCLLLCQVAKLIAGGPAASSGLVLEGDLLVAARNPLDPGWTDFAGLPLVQVYSWDLVLAFARGNVWDESQNIYASFSFLLQVEHA